MKLPAIVKDDLYPITPTNFARALVKAVENDPGAENKPMLFKIDGRFIRLTAIRSEARCTVLEFTEDPA